MYEKTYKWSSPYEWLEDAAKEWDAVRLYRELMNLASLHDSDTLQDEFQVEMDEDGYFKAEVEPEEDDWVTYDHRTFRRHGSPSSVPVVVDEDEDWRVILKARMDEDQFWPNVWFVSDHGNAHLLTLEDPQWEERRGGNTNE